MTKQILFFVFLATMSLLLPAAELSVYKGDLKQPVLKLKDLNGKIRDLRDYRGQVVMVNFWASWCPPCRIEMPSMYRLKQKMKGKPFTILAVNMAETKQEVNAFLPPQLRKSFVVLMDTDGKALRAWKVYAFPTSYIIGPKGKIRLALFGAAEWDDAAIVKKINALFPKKRK